MKGLNILNFKYFIDNGSLVLDLRPATEFTVCFIPGAVFMGLEGKLEEWVATLLKHVGDVVIVAPMGKEKEAESRLNGAGIVKINGYLDGGIDAWLQAGEKTDMIIDIEADELAMDIPFDPHLLVVDVRRKAEFAEGHIKDAENIPLDLFEDISVIAQFEDHQNLYLHCAGGYRSVIAASLLKRHGIHNLRNILGGWNKMKDVEKLQVEKDKSAMN